MLTPASYDEEPPALGVVLDEDRGSLPYALVHGESLVACAAWALGAAGVRILDVGTAWADVRGAGADLVLHDALCPLTPPDFIADCLAVARAEGEVVVATRAVTDTVRRLQPGSGGGPPELGALLDRDRLLTVTSPVVLPAAVLARLDGWPGADLADVAVRLGAGRMLTAPASGARVLAVDDLPVLEAVAQVPGREPGQESEQA